MEEKIYKCFVAISATSFYNLLKEGRIVKMSEVKEITETIKDFSQKMAAFENKISNESSWVWNSIKYSLISLSEVNIFLEECSVEAVESILADYAPLFRANGIDISKLKKLPKGISEQDVEVDINPN